MKLFVLLVPFVVMNASCNAGGMGHVMGGDFTNSNNITGGDSNKTTTSGCPLGEQNANNIGGPSICCSGHYAVCDGFEDAAAGGQPNTTWWAVEKFNQSYGLAPNQTLPSGYEDDNATVEISNTMAARGQYSLHVYALNENTVNNGWHHDMVVNHSIFPAPNNTFWGRAFLYYNGVVPNGHSTYMDGTGTIPGNNGVTYLRISTSSKLAVNYWGAPSGSSTNDHSINGNNVALPTGVWSCFEWEYKGDTNEVALYLNGDEIAHVQNTDNFTAPVYDTFRIGWETYSYQYNPTPPAFDMYYDEIALDYARIGCDN